MNYSRRFARSLVLLIAFLIIGLQGNATGAPAAKALDYMDSQAIKAFDRTITKYPPHEIKGKPTDKDLEQCASQLMLIKNGLSLYRDDLLSPAATAKLKKTIDFHLKCGMSARADLSGSRKRLGLIETICDHAEQASNLFALQKGTRRFEVAMRDYHTGIGNRAFNRALDFGVEQVWLDK